MAGSFVAHSEGVPQGSTLSLLLANVAAYELDRDLAELLAIFGRFGDDVNAICETLKMAKRARKILHRHAERAGTPINEDKSPGIRYFGDDPPPGIERVEKVNFVGYGIMESGITLADKAIEKIVGRAKEIIYLHLLHDPLHGRMPAEWTPWDERGELLSLMGELRSYLYGRYFDEADLREALRTGEAKRPARGIISRYPAVDSAVKEDLRKIDQRIGEGLEKAYAHRVKVFGKNGISLPVITTRAFAKGRWKDGDARALVPSAFLAWRYSRLARPLSTPGHGTYEEAMEESDAGNSELETIEFDVADTEVDG